MGKTNILLVDGAHRIGLAVARSLKLSGDYVIHLVAQSQGWSDAVQRVFRSTAVDSVHVMRIDSSGDGFFNDLTQLIAFKKIDFLIPAGHEGTLHIAFLKRELSRFCSVLVEDYEQVGKLHDKGNTVLLARQLGVPHPETFLPQDSEEAEIYAGNCTYPVVVKARKGVGTDGVWYAQDAAELMALYRRTSKERGPAEGFLRDRSDPMFQEYIPGELHDVAAFSLRGEMAAGLTQRRLLTRPLSGGKGIVNMTTFNEELLGYARRIVGHLKWDGVLLFDFKIDTRDGEPKLLEVNPRFWGTTWLSTCAGLNFPHNLVLAAKGAALEFPSDYRVGLVCRWPLYELGIIMEKPRSLARIFERVKGILSRFGCRDCVSDIVWPDWKPLVAEFVALSMRLWRDMTLRR